MRSRVHVLEGVQGQLGVDVIKLQCIKSDVFKEKKFILDLQNQTQYPSIVVTAQRLPVILISFWLSLYIVTH